MKPKFITMFGYSVSLPFTKDLLTNRPYFNYISVGSAQITYNSGVSMSYRLGAENQLSSGVRIWHVKPDIRYNEIQELEEVLKSLEPKEKIEKEEKQE